MTGTIINAAAIIGGSLIGMMFHSRLPKRITAIIFQGLGLFTMFLGLSMAGETQHFLIMIFSIVLGGVTGELLKIDKHVDIFSSLLMSKLKSSNEKFSEGLVTSFILFCVGSMTILGAIEEGLGGQPNLLMTKAILDGFSSIALASAMGSGVLFSVIPLFLFQGGLTLLVSFVGDIVSQPVIAELTAVGGLLLIGMALKILEIKQIKVINMLPALVFSIFLSYIFI